jgi:hypothetical protein
MAFSQAFRVVEGDSPHSHYFVLDMRPEARLVTVLGYPKGKLKEATSEYLAIEAKDRGKGAAAVLVSVDSMAALVKAYPNYYLDTTAFLRHVLRALS